MPEAATSNRCRALPTGLALLLLLTGAPAAADDPEALPLPSTTYPPLDTAVMVPTLEPVPELAPPPLTDAPAQIELRVPPPPEPPASDDGESDKAAPPPSEPEPDDGESDKAAPSQPAPDEVEAAPSSPEPEAHAEPRTDAPPRPSDSVDPVPRMTVMPPEPLAPPPLKTLEIMLDWYPGPQHAALLLATQNGQLERRGLAVTLITPADPTLPTRLLAAGRVDLAVSRQPLLHLQVDRGSPLLRVGTLVDLPLAGLLLRDIPSLTSLGQLAGKRIGYSDEDSRELLLPVLLGPHGIGLGELELVDVNFGAVTAMEEERLDGVITPQRLTQSRRLGDQGVATRLLKVEEFGLPSHEGLILVANRDHLGNKREAIRRLLDALAETTAWMIEHPEAAWQRLAEQEPALDTAANREAWMATLLRLSARPAALDQGGYQRFEAFLHERGLVEELTPVDKLAIDLGTP
jgi:putative hydroxymethylpyrimidine transport system substrate-binding protein